MRRGPFLARKQRGALGELSIKEVEEVTFRVAQGEVAVLDERVRNKNRELSPAEVRQRKPPQHAKRRTDSRPRLVLAKEAGNYEE